MTKQGFVYPFIQPDFLDALSSTGAATTEQGWSACHLQDADFFLPLWRRNHSWGEYVFDQGWEQGYRRAGLSYYPKLVTSIPFTPVPGPRWRGALHSAEQLWLQIRDSLDAQGASGWHLLFPDGHTREQLAGLPLVSRQACHFRWNNYGYGDFDDFLAQLTSRKRKSLRKERAGVNAHGLEIVCRQGEDIPDTWWQPFYHCYAMTYYKRGQHPYLPAGFFTRLASSSLASQLALVAAFAGGEMVAAAFYLFDDDSLYGRYWGCVREYDGLHFELCYYRGIELAIERGLRRFDPGVQGEHKILRGFEPEITWSLHWLRDQRFQGAIAQFCAEEARGVRAYQREARTLLPYRQGSEALAPKDDSG